MAENKKKTPTPRLTVAELQGVVAQHIEGCNLRIDEFEALGLERKIPGITHEVTRLHKMVEDIQSEIKNIRPDENNMFTNERNRAKLEEIINGRLIELNASITEEFTSLRTRINEIDAKVDTLGAAHNKLAVSHGKLTNDVRNVEIEVKAQHLSRGFIGLTTIASILAGVIVGLWWHMTTFTSTIPLNGTNVTYNDSRNDAGYPWLVGVGAAALTFFIILLIASLVMKGQSADRPRESDLKQIDDTKYVPPVPQNPNPVTASYTEDVAPTKLLPAAEGATHDTR